MGKLLTAVLSVVIGFPLLAAFAVTAALAALTSTPSTSGTGCAPVGTTPGEVAGYDAEQLGNAATIVAVGKRLHVPEEGWVIAIATAMQESRLRNLDYGDRDSLGLFQQRPSQGWGTADQITDPAYAATQLRIPGRLRATRTSRAHGRSGRRRSDLRSGVECQQTESFLTARR